LSPELITGVLVEKAITSLFAMAHTKELHLFRWYLTLKKRKIFGCVSASNRKTNPTAMALIANFKKAAGF